MKEVENINEEFKKLAPEEILQFEVKARDSEKKVEEVKKNVVSLQTKIEDLYNELKSKVNAASSLMPDLQQKITNITNAEDKSTKINNTLVEQERIFEEQKEKVESIFNRNKEIVENFERLEETLGEAKDISGKIEAVHSSVGQRKQDVDSAYYEIFGQTLKDEETGEETKIKGLKEEIKNSFKGLEENFTREKTKNENLYREFYEKNEQEVNLIKNKIDALLPSALTAGLSAAFSKKKEEEIKESQESKKYYIGSIFVMILISSIPFLLSVSFLKNGEALDEIILKLPRLVLSILPLYVPVFWVGYFYNRKLNLSKRLIEEYAHKEVLSKTYEGLSKQIEELGENDNESELKVKLLFNLLEVSSENPGKLISDYNKADHPLFDTLDKSMKLTNAVERLNRIPGFAKLAEKLAKKSEKDLKEKTKKVENGLESG